MFSLKLLLFLFQAPCSGYELKLKALLLERILRHDEVFVAKACLLLRGWMVTIVLRVIFYGVLVKVVLPVVMFLLFGCSSDRVFIVFASPGVLFSPVPVFPSFEL